MKFICWLFGHEVDECIYYSDHKIGKCDRCGSESVSHMAWTRWKTK